MTTEKTQNEKYTQDGITFRSKEDWENYNSTYKGVLNDNINTNQSNNENKETQTVKISDIKMPFGSMVVFMVKWVIASIPAIIILTILFASFSGFFVGIISMFN
jgi:hypothetical protein